MKLGPFLKRCEKVTAPPFFYRKVCLFGIIGTLLIQLVLVRFSSNAEHLKFDPINHSREGESFLGLCHQRFPCERAKSLLGNQSVLAFGWLDGAFNDSSDKQQQCPCGTELLNDRREKVVRVHIINGPGLRNRRLQRHELGYGFTITSLDQEVLRGLSEETPTKFIQQYRARLKKVAAQIKEAKGKISCYLSPCLECDLSEASRAKLLDIAREEVPECKLVDNPLNKSCIPGYICETHQATQSKPAPCIADMDGVDQSEIDYQKWSEVHQHCLIRFKWQKWYNLLNISAENNAVGKNVSWIAPLDR